MNYQKLTSCTFAALFLVSTLHTSLGAQDAEEVDKLKRASARLIAKYLKETTDEKTGLWVSPTSNLKYKTAPTGETKLVPGSRRVGWREVWKWVSSPTEDDPYRKIYKKVKVGVYERTGEMVTRKITKRTSDVRQENHYFSRWIEGQNALGAYALLCAGEHPEGFVLSGVMEWLQFMAELGLPDETPDLSLMIMAFLRADIDGYEDIIDRGMTKLLYGQITNGSGRGQWGHYSINFKNLKLMNSYAEKLEKYKGAISGLVAGKDFMAMSKKEKFAYYKKMELESAISWLNRRTKEISREFTLGRVWFHARREIVGEEGAIKKYYYYPCALYDARVLRMGDLTNTEFALMALAEAQRAGWFEKKRQERIKKKRTLILRRLKGRLKAPDPPDVKVAAARAATMIKKFQKKDGTWDLCHTELKTINPYKEMRNMKIKPKKRRKDLNVRTHDVEPPDPTLVGTTSALHSLALICEIAGEKSVRRKYGVCINKGKAAYEKRLKGYLKNNEAVPEHEHAFLPYRYWLTIPTVRNNIGLDALEGKDNALLGRILDMQEADGSFGSPLAKKFRNHYMPPVQFIKEIQALWVKEKVYHGKHLYPKLDPKLVCGALTLIYYSYHLKDNVTGPRDWPDVFEYFTNKRNILDGINTTAVPATKAEDPKAKSGKKPGKKPEEKPIDLPEPKKEALKDDETF